MRVTLKFDFILTFILLFYSILMLILSILGEQTLIFNLLFYLFIPGYVFSIIFIPKLAKLEKIAVSIGLSLSLLLGIRGFLRMLNVLYLFSVDLILIIFSIICLIIKLLTRG